MGKFIRTHVLVCAGGGCIASGSLEVSKKLQEAVKNFDLEDEVKVVETGCLGPCAAGPVVAIYPEGVFYQKVNPEDAEVIVEEHLLKGRIVERLLYVEPTTAQVVPALKEISFFKQQEKIVLRNCGVVDPTRIQEYIARDGYSALSRVLTEMKPDEVIETVKKSGLRGRGGAGFPTGVKWEFTRKARGEKKFVLCNADEGDPGAFMDRSVLEGDPHSLVEAMAIAAYAIGSSEGYVYVRAEYPLAVERLSKALEQARDYGLLGKGIMGTDFNFDLEIRMGSGAFVCGEETALMTSIEGNRGEPRPRPPFPAQKGLWGMPSLLNNVETYANIPVIILKGPEWYASFGTEMSRGTKVFALAGAVNNTGLVEVQIGTPLGKIIFDIGGGVPDGRKFKAAQIGGPSGGCSPREHLNVPVDYESLDDLGAIMGSGGLIVMDEDTCMVDMARYFMEFVQDESCGKCPPCRIGTKRMLEILNRICEGKGEEGDIERLTRLGKIIKDTALCGLGQTAPNSVLSTIRHFREEYEAHIKEKCCSAGVCPELVRAPCQNACPAGVDVPGYVSLLSQERFSEAIILHRERNPFPAICSRVCPSFCESKCRRGTIDKPVAIRHLKRAMSDREVFPELPEIRTNTANKRRKIAIIGGGPAGLSCAYFLARLGFVPVVYEAAGRLGGMLVQCIPAYRLPRNIVDRELQLVGRLVQVRAGMRLGLDFTLDDLRENGTEAIFLGIGAQKGLPLNILGEDREGVIQAMDFLRKHNLRNIARPGSRTVVIGGGNAAVDAARTAIRLGVDGVTVLYRRTRAEMPAYAEEIEAAEDEGVKIEYLAAPVRIAGDGKVIGVEYIRMSLGEFDKSGRRQPVSVAGSEFVLEADTVMPAIGQVIDAAGVLESADVQTDSSGFLMADAVTGQTNVPWIFAGGDAVSGPGTVVESIAAGERAAVGINRFLTGEEHAFWREDKETGVPFDPEADPVPYERFEPKMLPPADRIGNFSEICPGMPENAVSHEGQRCLRCEYREHE